MTTRTSPKTRTPKSDTPDNVTDITYGPVANARRAKAQRAATKKPGNRPVAPPTLGKAGSGGGTVLDPSRFWEQGEDGDTFRHRLSVTFPNEEVYVTCKTVEVADVVLEGNFPYEFTSQMLNGLQSFAGDEGELDAFRNAGESATDVLAAMTAMPQLRPFVDALFVSAVVDPPCFLDKEEARAEGGLWVGYVRLMDKMSLMARMQGEGDDLAATFRAPADAAV